MDPQQARAVRVEAALAVAAQAGVAVQAGGCCQPLAAQGCSPPQVHCLRFLWRPVPRRSNSAGRLHSRIATRSFRIPPRNVKCLAPVYSPGQPILRPGTVTDIAHGDINDQFRHRRRRRRFRCWLFDRNLLNRNRGLLSAIQAQAGHLPPALLQPARFGVDRLSLIAFRRRRKCRHDRPFWMAVGSSLSPVSRTAGYSPRALLQASPIAPAQPAFAWRISMHHPVPLSSYPPAAAEFRIVSHA